MDLFLNEMLKLINIINFVSININEEFLKQFILCKLILKKLTFKKTNFIKILYFYPRE